MTMTMNLEAATAGEWSAAACPACPAEGSVGFGEETRQMAMSVAANPAEAALTLLELENAGLRRMVVELLEKNQRLREKMRA